MKKRIRYEIDETTGDVHETELGVVGDDACQIELDGGKFAEQLSALCDRAEAKGFDVKDWLDGWGRCQRGLQELVDAANGEPRLRLHRPKG